MISRRIPLPVYAVIGYAAYTSLIYRFTRLSPSQPGRCTTYRPRKDGRLSLTWVFGYTETDFQPLTE